MVVVASALVIAWSLLAPPHPVLDKADRVGYAICHRIPERSFFLDGRQLPLCARCTGTFLGALLGLGAMLLRRRGRASGLPSAGVLALLIAFMAVWAFDGLNSYLTLFPGAPHLYGPRNWLRLSTGLLNGLALITFVFPIFNFTLWHAPPPDRVVKNAGEMMALLPLAGVLALIVQMQIDWLLYPLALLSSLGVVVLLSLINSVIAALLLGREAYATSWRQALVPVTVGVALAVGELAGLSLLRSYLVSAFGISF